MKNYTKIK